jgi:hypothetical protein
MPEAIPKRAQVRVHERHNPLKHLRVRLALGQVELERSNVGPNAISAGIEVLLLSRVDRAPKKVKVEAP